MPLMKESVFRRKKHHHLGLTNRFKTNPLNIIFDDFSIWLLGFKTEFSCLYLPQGHYFMSTSFYIERKSIFKINSYISLNIHVSDLIQLLIYINNEYRCIFEQETLPLLLSTGWFQEWIRA